MKTLKAKLSKKLKKNGGFTLIEMLIVVAIIAILVAVSIPLVGTALGKAKEATDDANIRSAKAAAVIEYLGNGKDVNGLYYDAENGKLVTSTEAKTLTPYKQVAESGKDIIQVTETNGVISVDWAAKPTA